MHWKTPLEITTSVYYNNCYKLITVPYTLSGSGNKESKSFTEQLPSLFPEPPELQIYMREVGHDNIMLLIQLNMEIISANR